MTVKLATVWGYIDALRGDFKFWIPITCMDTLLSSSSSSLLSSSNLHRKRWAITVSNSTHWLNRVYNGEWYVSTTSYCWSIELDLFVLDNTRSAAQREDHSDTGHYFGPFTDPGTTGTMTRLVIAKAVWYRPLHASGSWDRILRCQSWFRSLSFTFGKCVRHLLYGHRGRPSFLIRFAIRWWPCWRLLSCQRLDLCKIAEWLTTSCCSRNHRDSQSPDWYWHDSRLSRCIYRGNFKLDGPFESFDQQWIR